MATTSDKKVNVVLSVNAVNFSSGIDKIKGKLNEMGGVSKTTSHAMVSDVQATSGALRILDGGIQNNIRSAERFLANIKGVGAAMQAIYPAVGIIAVGALLARGVTELTEFIKKTKEAGAQFTASFQEMQNSARLSNDELAKTNINLENQIAKLTGKHENVLASQLIDARIEADKLADSAAKAAKEMKDLLDKNQAGVLALAMGSGLTGELFGNIQNFQNLKASAQQHGDDALHSGDQKAADAAKAQYEQLLKNERAYLQKQIADRTATTSMTQRVHDATNGDHMVTVQVPKMAGDQTKNLTALRGALGLNYDQSDRIGLDAQNQKDTGTLKGIEDSKNLATKQMEQYRDEFANLTASLVAGPGEEDAQFKARMLAEEAQFWAQKLSITKKGSDEHKQIQKELADIDRQANQQYASAQNEAIKLQQERDKFISSSFGDSLNLSRDSDALGGLKTGGKDTGTRLAAMNESVTIANQNADAWRETQIQIGLAAGTLSKYDAALQTMQMHRDQYDRANIGLAASRASLTARYGAEGTNSSPEALAAWQQLNNQQSTLTGQYKVQSAQDQQDVSAQTGTGSLRTSMNQYIQQSQDTANQVRDIWSASFSGINEQLENMLTGQKASWKSFARSIAKEFAGIFLQRGESAIMSSLFPSSSTSKSGSGGGGGITSLFSGIGSLFSGLGFADGGSPPVGKFSMVGENGPELRYFGSPSTIVPGGFGGSSTTHNWTIDARGATDPAMVNAAVQRGIAKALPSISAVTMHAQREASARKPSSSR
jgi:lambda family phage tail tape measure protein